MSTPTKPTEPVSDHRHAAPTGQRQQRLPALPPALLTDEQKSLAANMKEEIARSFQGFVNARDDGVAGRRPADPTTEEAVAYDFATGLVLGGVLAEQTYRAAVEQFGTQGAAEPSYLIGYYCMVSVTLNTFDVPVPEVRH